MRRLLNAETGEAEVFDELNDGNYATVEDCMIEHDDGTCEILEPLKGVLEKRIAASDRGEFSSKTFDEIVNEAWAEAEAEK